MPKKKKGKKGKKEKKKTPHQLQVEALTRACDEAERVYRDTRDLNARLSRENEERRLTLAERRAEADEQAELFECSERQDARERKQRATQLKHEKTLLQAQVEQLRLQRERRTELYLENETLEGDLDRAREEARRAQEAADNEALDQERLLQNVETDAENAFREELSQRVDAHFKTAYHNLNAVAKAKYRRTEVLREELAFQHEGIVAVSRKIAEDSQRKSEVKHEVKSLEKADHDKAIQTTLEKRKRDQALKDADRLNQQLTELRNESEGFERESAEALSVVPPPPPGSDALHHLENVLREREAELCDLERRAATWEKRASAARACAVDIRNGSRRAGPPKNYDDVAASLDEGDGAHATLDARLWRGCHQRWSESDADLTAAPETLDVASVSTLPTLSKSVGERTRKTQRRPRPRAPRVQPAHISRRAPASLGFAQIMAFRSIARFERVRAATDLELG